MAFSQLEPKEETKHTYVLIMIDFRQTRIQCRGGNYSEGG